MRSTTATHAGAVTLALALALTLTGCGILDRSGKSTDQAGANATAPRSVDDLGEVVATHDVQISKGAQVFPVRVELYELRRRDGFMTVNVKLTRTDQGTQGDRWQVSDAFQGDTISHTFAGVTVVDRKNRKRHLVARVNPGAGRNQEDRTAREEYLASSGLSSVFVAPGQSIHLYATFGAPPDDVAAVDVVIPRVPVFENVPLG